MFTYSSVGGTRIGDTELAELRGRVVDVARSHGYPDTAERLPELEAALARILRDSLPMTPNEASQEDAWSYLTCCWLLDVAVWRFGSDADERRFIGNVNRNTFRRLWWRAEILGADIDLARLGEDELVNIMERPTIAGDRRLSRSIAAEFLRRVSAEGATERMQLMREVMKRLMRLTPFLSFPALVDAELERLIATTFDAAAAGLAGHEVPATPREHAPVPPASPDVKRVETATHHLAGTSAPGEPESAARGTLDDAAAVAISIAQRTGTVDSIKLRDAIPVTPNQAREVFRTLVEAGALDRRGVRRGTHYVMSTKGRVQPPSDGVDPGRAVDEHEPPPAEPGTVARVAPARGPTTGSGARHPPSQMFLRASTSDKSASACRH